MLAYLISLEHGSISFMFFSPHFLLVKGSGELESRIIAFLFLFFSLSPCLLSVFLLLLFLCNIFRKPKTDSVGNLRIKGTWFGFLVRGSFSYGSRMLVCFYPFSFFDFLIVIQVSLALFSSQR